MSDPSDTEEFIIPAQSVAPANALVLPTEDIVLDQVVAATPPAADAPAPEPTVVVCPRCGADGLARAPMPIVHSLLRWFSLRRRYRCTNCHRVVWRHRVLRQTSAAGDDSLDSQTPLAWEVLFFTAAAVALVVYLGVAMKECADAAPPPP